MENSVLLNQLRILSAEFESEKIKLYKHFVKENAEFTFGQFICSGKNIIKVQTIVYNIPSSGVPVPIISYKGPSYRKSKGVIVKTLNPPIGHIQHTIELLDTSNLIIEE